MKPKTILAVATVALCLPACAEAAPNWVQTGQWTVEAKVADTGAHWNNFGICIKGNNTWYNTDQVVGSGRWMALADDFLWHGNMDGIKVNDAGQNKMGENVMVGYASQWVDGQTASTSLSDNLFVLTTWTFKSDKCSPPFGR